MKNIILLGNRNESDRLNHLLRLLNKYDLNTIIYNSEGVTIDNRTVKASPFDLNMFYDLVCAAGFKTKSNEVQYNYIQLYCDSVLQPYSIAFTGDRVILQPVSVDYFNTL